jgi:lipopolysaccharide export system protein LptA
MMRLFILMSLVLACGASSAFAQKSTSPVLPGGNSKDPISIDASKLDYYDKDQKLIYTGNVIAKQGDSILRAQNLILFLTRTNTVPSTQNKPASPSDNASTPPSSSGTQLKRMEASGNVTITSKDQVGMGDRATYDKGENKVYMFGNVSLSQGPNITKGEKLIYDLTTGQAHVESVTKGRVMSIFTPGSGEDDDKKPSSAKKSSDKSKP